MGASREPLKSAYYDSLCERPSAFPTWLAPTPAIVLPIADRVHPYAHEVVRALREHGVRAELDARNEKIGLKIREAQLAKIPYMLVVGDREAAAGTVSVRSRDGRETPAQPIDAVAAQIRNEILNREPGPAPSAAAADKAARVSPRGISGPVPLR